MDVNIVMKKEALDFIGKNQKEALSEAVEAALEDLKQSQAMPFESGRLQDSATYIDESEIDIGKISIVSDTDYAAKLYFHPEFSFQTVKNKLAGGRWFGTYIDGEKKEFMREIYAKVLKQLNEGGGQN